MKFKTKKDLLQEAVDFPTSMYNRGIGEAFNTFKERVDFFKKYANHKGFIQMYGQKNKFKPYMKLYDDHPDIANQWYESDEDYEHWLFNYCFGGIE